MIRSITTTFGLLKRETPLSIALCMLLLFTLTLNVQAMEISRDRFVAQQTLDFADILFENGDYYRAITEYKRFIFLFPDNPLVPNARYKIGLSYFEGEKYKDAIKSFKSLSVQVEKNEISKKSMFTLAELYFKDAQYQRSALTYERFLTEYPDVLESDKAKYKLGWSYLYSEEYDKAKTNFDGISADNPFGSMSKNVSMEMQELTDLKMKSPGLAGGLSAVLPGAGQVYCGRYQDGATAFVLNGLFIWGTVEMFEDDHYAAGGVLAFFSLMWYSGNIFSAVSSAHKYNRDLKSETLERLNSKYNISLIYDGVTKANLLVFNLKY